MHGDRHEDLPREMISGRKRKSRDQDIGASIRSRWKAQKECGPDDGHKGRKGAAALLDDAAKAVPPQWEPEIPSQLI